MATLKVSVREDSGKGVARKLRSRGRVPGVVYGHGDRPEALSVDAHELELLLAHAHVGNTLVALEREGGGRTDALIRAVQMHPVRPEVMHIDFQHVHAGEVMRVPVPVRLSGNPRGVMDDGGILDHILFELEVEVLPREIPEYAEVDISNLGLGDAVRVRDVTFAGNPASVKVLTDEDITVAAVVAPTVRGSDGPAEGDLAPEPEVVRRGGGEEA